MKKILVLANKDNVIFNFRSELMLALKQKGYDVVFVCPYGKKLDFFLEKGFRNIDILIDRRGKNIFKDFKLLQAYKTIFKKEKPDLVLTYTSKPSIYGGYECSRLKIPYIVNNAGLMSVSNPIFKRVMNILYRKGYSKSACLMFQNSQEREYMLGLLKKNQHFCDIPGSGVNLSFFQYKEYPQENGNIVFNFVARIAEFKGINEYLKCAEIIRKKYPNTIFRVFGDFDEEKYRGIIEDMDRKGIIEYKGVSYDMRTWIEKCHAVIHSSHYEGMTNVVLEHSAIGRPCIGSNISGVKEGIENGKTGFIFEVKNVDSLVSCVERFIELPPSKKKEMGVAARHKMEKEFDREIVTNTYLREIKRIVGE